MYRNSSLRTRILVAVDESTKSLDVAVDRFIFCLAEIPLNTDSDRALELIRDFKLQWEHRNPGSKFHLTDFTDGKDIDTIVQLIVDLRPTIKLFVFYNINQEYYKEDCLKQIINIAQRNNYRDDQVEWVIEDSEKYESIVKALILTNDTALTIVPDVFCNLFARTLNAKNNEDETKVQEMISKTYSKIKPLIRLQYFATNKQILSLSKGNIV